MKRTRKLELQIESINLTDVQFGSKTKMTDHLLTIDPEELEKIILTDRRVGKVGVNIVSPGDRVRIVNVVEVLATPVQNRSGE